MNPFLFALFNGLGNIYNAVMYNHRLLEIILFVLVYFVFKDVVKCVLGMKRRGWFARSNFDKKPKQPRS